MNTRPLVSSSLSVEQLEEELKTSSFRGLQQDQISQRQDVYGRNVFIKGHLVWPRLLLRQFSSLFIMMLIVSAVLLFFLESRVNALIILGIVLVNGMLTFFQEFRATRALELLKEHLQLFCPTIREGKVTLVPHDELVPGDLIILEPGNFVPADVRLISGMVFIDESLLTGESGQIEKTAQTLSVPAQDIYNAPNMAFSGTSITKGTARALVIATGAQSFFGEVSRETLGSFAHSGFQERLAVLSKFLLLVICSTLVLIIGAHIAIKGWQQVGLELVIFAISLVIGLTPEMLPTVTSFALSKGAVLLARHNVIVKRLSAIEDLGSITMLLTDKTGTLTENRLMVASACEAPGVPLFEFAYLAARHKATDGFDKATVDAFKSKHHAATSYEVLDEQPFNPTKRKSAVNIKKDGVITLIVRGAVEEICSQGVPLSTKEWITEQNAAGNRVLAFGYKLHAQLLTDTDLTFAGCIAFTDPIKPSAAPALQKAQKLGIQVKIVTGDSKEVGAYVARAIGLTQELNCAISGVEFSALTAEEKRRALSTYVVFARFLPAQKYELVSLFREQNTVGFLGDGINDAPALKEAHVGIVVKTASDLAKEASDVILLKKSLFEVIYGIGIGRNVFANTLKYITISIASNFGNFYSLALASLFLDFLPLLPRQILLVNVLSDFPMVAIATDRVDFDELTLPPRFVMSDTGPPQVAKRSDLI